MARHSPRSGRADLPNPQGRLLRAHAAAGGGELDLDALDPVAARARRIGAGEGDAETRRHGDTERSQTPAEAASLARGVLPVTDH